MNEIDTSINALYASHQISGRLLTALKNFGIDDLRELEGVGIKTLRMARGWGKGMVGELSALAEKAGVVI